MVDKILCIDDDPITLLICGIMLQKTSFCKQMDKALNGLVGLRYFEDLLSNENAIIPKLILLDINMPEMNGWEFLEKYTNMYMKHFPGCQVIILTSSVNPADKELGRNHEHVINFIEKPLSLERLEQLKQIPELKHYF